LLNIVEVKNFKFFVKWTDTVMYKFNKEFVSVRV